MIARKNKAKLTPLIARGFKLIESLPANDAVWGGAA